MSIPLNQWVFVALTISPTQAVLYYDDGTLHSETNNHTHAAYALNQSMRMGDGFRGILDDVQIHSYTWSSAEIHNYWKRGMPVPPAPIPADLEFSAVPALSFLYE